MAKVKIEFELDNPTLLTFSVGNTMIGLLSKIELKARSDDAAEDGPLFQMIVERYDLSDYPGGIAENVKVEIETALNALRKAPCVVFTEVKPKEVVVALDQNGRPLPDQTKKYSFEEWMKIGRPS